MTLFEDLFLLFTKNTPSMTRGIMIKKTKVIFLKLSFTTVLFSAYNPPINFDIFFNSIVEPDSEANIVSVAIFGFFNPIG